MVLANQTIGACQPRIGKDCFSKNMTAASSFSILLIQPSPALSAIPPSTLTQARKLSSAESMEAHRWDVRLDASNKGGSRLLERLERLSVRYHTRHCLSLNEIPPAQFKDLVAALDERRTRVAPVPLLFHR